MSKWSSSSSPADLFSMLLHLNASPSFHPIDLYSTSNLLYHLYLHLSPNDVDRLTYREANRLRLRCGFKYSDVSQTPNQCIEDNIVKLYCKEEKEEDENDNHENENENENGNIKEDGTKNMNNNNNKEVDIIDETIDNSINNSSTYYIINNDISALNYSDSSYSDSTYSYYTPSINSNQNNTIYTLRIHMSLPPSSAETVISSMNLIKSREIINICDFNIPCPPIITGSNINLDYNYISTIQSYYYNKCVLNHIKLKQNSSRILPDLIYADVMRDFNLGDLKFKLIGSGNFGHVYGCDLCIIKIYNNPIYLKRILECKSHFSNYGLDSSYIPDGYISRNVLINKPDKNWFELWVDNANKGVFHCDLKPDNIVNGALIDHDNYFFQAAGHKEWVMSDSRYYPTDIVSKGWFVADWINIKKITNYNYDILICEDTWNYLCLKTGKLTSEEIKIIDKLAGCTMWRDANLDFINSSEAGIFKLDNNFGKARELHNSNFKSLPPSIITKYKDQNNLKLNNDKLFEVNTRMIMDSISLTQSDLSNISATIDICKLNDKTYCSIKNVVRSKELLTFEFVAHSIPNIVLESIHFHLYSHSGILTSMKTITYTINTDIEKVGTVSFESASMDSVSGECYVFYNEKSNYSIEKYLFYKSLLALSSHSQHVELSRHPSPLPLHPANFHLFHPSLLPPPSGVGDTDSEYLDE